MHFELISAEPVALSTTFATGFMMIQSKLRPVKFPVSVAMPLCVCRYCPSDKHKTPSTRARQRENSSEQHFDTQHRLSIAITLRTYLLTNVTPDV